MANYHPVSTPADSNGCLVSSLTPTSEKYPYSEAVGRLLYLTLAKRPVISFAVGQVGQFANRPGKSHWNAVKRILAYLKGSKHLGICFNGTGSILRAFSDDDYAGNLDSRCSTSGYILFLNKGPVSWGNVKQKCIALSTTESEYVAMCTTVK